MFRFRSLSIAAAILFLIAGGTAYGGSVKPQPFRCEPRDGCQEPDFRCICPGGPLLPFRQSSFVTATGLKFV